MNISLIACLVFCMNGTHIFKARKLWCITRVLRLVVLKYHCDLNHHNIVFCRQVLTVKLWKEYGSLFSGKVLCPLPGF